MIHDGVNDELTRGYVQAGVVALFNIVKLDSAYMNHIYRHQLLEKINGVILLGDEQRSVVNDSLLVEVGLHVSPLRAGTGGYALL
jgi:hypothetical protein